MDEHLIERAQAYVERTVNERVAAITAKPQRESAMHCEDCGEDIPEKRREAIPGVRFCVTCQTVTEQKSRHYR